MPKRRKKNLFFHPIFFTILGLITLFFVSAPLVKNINKKYMVDNEIKELENEISKLETDNKDLHQFISHLDSEEFIEEQARINLGLKKKGEEVVVLKNEEIISSDENLKNKENNQNDKISNPQKWWRYFFQ